jgi:Tfp pilus assembly PilM family ATPase
VFNIGQSQQPTLGIDISTSCIKVLQPSPHQKCLSLGTYRLQEDYSEMRVKVIIKKNY